MSGVFSIQATALVLRHWAHMQPRRRTVPGHPRRREQRDQARDRTSHPRLHPEVPLPLFTSAPHGKLFASHEKSIFFSLACFKAASHGIRSYEPSSQAPSAIAFLTSSVPYSLTAASCHAALLTRCAFQRSGSRSCFVAFVSSLGKQHFPIIALRPAV
jgi:hypothetical protein